MDVVGRKHRHGRRERKSHGIKAGTADVTVTTADGSFTATCAVTVNAATSSGTVADDIDITKADTNTSGHKLEIESPLKYYKITTEGNYQYSATAAVGTCLIGTGNNRPIVITAGANVESITMVVRFAVSDGANQTAASSATLTVSGGSSETVTSTVKNGVVEVSEYTVTLTANQTLTIASAKRLALVGVTAQVTPKTT